MRTARIASGLAALTLAGGLGVAGASSASADQRHNDERGRDNGHRSCQVDATKHGDNLRVQIRSNTGDGFAFVRANFNEGRDDTNRVNLNRSGDGSTSFSIPRRADWVNVTAAIRERGQLVTCSDRVRV